MISWFATHVPRLVSHRYPDLLWRLPPHGRTAYLTFDDGPTRQMTGILLDLLAHFDIRATFFVEGAHVVQEPALFRQIAAAGHTIGNHTWSHPDAWRTPARRVLQELERTTRLLEDETGGPVRWMRPPYGHFTRPMRLWAQARRQRVVMWDLMPGDFLPNASARRVKRRLAADLRPGSIVVLHDNPKAAVATPSALRDLLPRWLDEGWRFAPLAPWSGA